MLLRPGYRQKQKRDANYRGRMLREGNQAEYIRTALQNRMPWSPKPDLNLVFNNSSFNRASQHARDVYDMEKRNTQEKRALMIGKTTTRTAPGFLGKTAGGATHA